MRHNMKLYEQNFNELKEGIKIREYRLNDEKRQLIKIGDEINFLKLPNLDESYSVVVENIEYFKTWNEAYKKYFIEDFINNYDSVESVVEDTYNGYYSREESNKYGCVVLSLSRKNRNNS